MHYQPIRKQTPASSAGLPRLQTTCAFLSHITQPFSHTSLALLTCHTLHTYVIPQHAMSRSSRSGGFQTPTRAPSAALVSHARHTSRTHTSHPTHRTPTHTMTSPCQGTSACPGTTLGDNVSTTKHPPGIGNPHGPLLPRALRCGEFTCTRRGRVAMRRDSQDQT